MCRDTLQNGTKGDAEEKNCWITLLFLFSLHTKSILVASYHYGWTTDFTWTILMMSLLRFWALIVLGSLLSMEGQKALGFHQNYLKGGVSDFWKPMLIFEITKTNTPLPQKGLAPILIAPPHTYATQATISSVKQSKTNVTLCIHRTRAARQNTIEVIIISDAIYTGCWAVRQIPDRTLLPRSIYEVLTQISNDFQWSLYRVQADCCGALRPV